MRILKIAALAALIVLPVGHAQASVLGSLLSFDGNLDLLVDDSAAFIVDRGGDADILEVGDLLQGAFNLDNVDGSPVPLDNSIFGVFSFVVTGISGGPTGQVVQFGSAAGTDNVLSLLSGGGVDLTGVAAAGTETGLVIVESATVGLQTTDLNAATLFSSDFSGFDAVIAAGFLDADDQQTVVAGAFVDVTDLAGITSTAIPVQLAEFSTTLSVTDSIFSGPFLPIGNPNPIAGGAIGDLIGSGTISTPTTGLADNGFLFSDDGIFAVNAVPEATSLLVWSLLAISVTTRHRKKA